MAEHDTTNDGGQAVVGSVGMGCESPCTAPPGPTGSGGKGDACGFAENPRTTPCAGAATGWKGWENAYGFAENLRTTPCTGAVAGTEGWADACDFVENLWTTPCTGPSPGRRGGQTPAALPKIYGRPHVPGPQPEGRVGGLRLRRKNSWTTPCTGAVTGRLGRGRRPRPVPLRGTQPDGSCTIAKNRRRDLTNVTNHANLEIETDELCPDGAFAPGFSLSRGSSMRFMERSIAASGQRPAAFGLHKIATIVSALLFTIIRWAGSNPIAMRSARMLAFSRAK